MLQAFDPYSWVKNVPVPETTRTSCGLIEKVFPDS